MATTNMTETAERQTPGVLLQGDSITPGYGSVDGTGDLNGSFGFYEQLLARRYVTEVAA